MSEILGTAAQIITVILVPTVGFFARRNITQGERLSAMEGGQTAVAEQVKLLREETKDMRSELRDDIQALAKRMDRG